MIWTILYTLLAFANLFFAYCYILRMKVTRNKGSYVFVLGLTCLIQIGAYVQWGTEWRDTLIILCGWFATVFLVAERKIRAFLMYPIVLFFVSVVNVLGAYGMATVLKVPIGTFIQTGALLCMAQWTGILLLGLYSIVTKGRHKEEVGLTSMQYIVLLVGVAGMFGVVAFSQALLYGQAVSTDIKLGVANGAAVVALLFVGLSFWHCATWKRAYRYQAENEMYALFLEEQEVHIRSLIEGDERRRRLRHDMAAHMQAMDSMVEKGQLSELKEYIFAMKEKMGIEQGNYFTSIVAVDAVIAQCKLAAEGQGISWEWSGRIEGQNKVSVYHGLGHKNVEEIVHKHAGKITYEVNEGMFEVTVVI